MVWNCQQPDWPHFRYDAQVLVSYEAAFLKQGGIVIGTFRHLGEEDQSLLTVDVIGGEALGTSAIEGEALDRASLQSSIRRELGIATDRRRVRPAEKGIAEMLVDVYRTVAEPLDARTLFRWHKLLLQGRRGLRDVGRYRSQAEPVQIVSGPIHAPRVHFEAPPAARLGKEMARFYDWFDASAPGSRSPMPALARAGIAHLYFESIHPFEDGNGRIGRAIAEKALAQGLGQPSLTALSVTIERRRKSYYEALERANRDNEVTDWLVWFAGAVLDAQHHTQGWIGFLLAKTKLLDRLRGTINSRQEKALLRMLHDGPDGFEGGMSASKYTTITGAPPATARRHLAELVGLGALVRTGDRKTTRSWLPFGGDAK
jgi:Fic family protein